MIIQKCLILLPPNTSLILLTKRTLNSENHEKDRVVLHRVKMHVTEVSSQHAYSLKEIIITHLRRQPALRGISHDCLSY